MTVDIIHQHRYPDSASIDLAPAEFSISRLLPGIGRESRATRQQDYSISLLVRGSLTQYIDCEKHKVTAPAIFSMAPGQIYQYTAVESPEIVTVSFSRDFLMLEMQGWIACWECMFGHVVMDISDDDLEGLLQYTDLMFREFHMGQLRKDVILRNILQAFIVSIARLRHGEVPVMQIDNQQNKLVHQFKVYVDEYFQKKTQVSEYAELLFITPGHLNDVIKSTVGKTAKQVIDEKRVAEAKRLLFYGSYSIKEISGLLNFEDDAYFNRYFKKHTGQTPFAFQRTIREKYS